MSIVLSHTTAKAVYQAAHSASAKDTEPCNPAAIYGSCPTGTLLDAAAEWLTKHDVSLDANDCLEVMVFDRRNARYAMNCQCHVSSKRFSSSRFIELKDGIFIVGVELCALQAATYLPFRELVEYYFELCGAYSLGTDSSTSYNERFALTSTERLKQFFNSITRCDGLALARKAIQCVRDGCRSPMETAFVMMLTLPKMNCLPFLGHEKWEAFFMRVDLRVKHDIEARKAAIGLFELGHGYKSAAIALSLPVEAVRRWQEIYRAFGSEVLLRMDGKQGRYTYEQKVAAASAVVDGGMTKTEAMAAFGIMSMSPLKKWCALYRRGGAEALRPRPKGRPRGSKARPRTREEELEERCRRLEAEVAYLKKLRALVERDGL